MFQRIFLALNVTLVPSFPESFFGLFVRFPHPYLIFFIRVSFAFETRLNPYIYIRERDINHVYVHICRHEGEHMAKRYFRLHLFSFSYNFLRKPTQFEILHDDESYP